MLAQLVAIGVFGRQAVIPPEPIFPKTTMGDVIQRALEEIGIATYVYDLAPDELASGIRQLDRMLRQWEGEGVALGYVKNPLPMQSDELGTPDWADEALALNLALKLAPSFGKTANAQTRASAKMAYGLAVAKTLKVPRMRNSVSRVHGAGNRWFVR